MATDVHGNQDADWYTETVELPANILPQPHRLSLPSVDETTRPDLPVQRPRTATVQEMAVFFEQENALLAQGSKHLFVKIGHVRLKIRAIYVNQADPEYLSLLIDDEKDEVCLIVPRYWRFEVAYGNQRFLW